MRDFILLPWECRASYLNSKAHAETRLEVGGRKRDFLLKLREGVIYFRETMGKQVFAILQKFDDSLANDRKRLMSVFQTEMAVNNYAAFYTKHDYFPNLPVAGYFMLLVRPDGTGWMREHFDTEWFPFPDWGRPLAMNMWGDNLRAQIVVNILPTVKDILLQRILNPEIRLAETPRWIGGDSNEVAALVTAAVRLFPPPSKRDFSSRQFVLQVVSHSIFNAYEEGFIWLHSAQHLGGRYSPYRREPDGRWSQFIQLMKKQFQFIGLEWIQGGDTKETYSHPRNESFFQEGLQKWGENWRGNWAPKRSVFEIVVPNWAPHRSIFEIALHGLATVSTEEKRESALLLREWLKDKMPGRQIEAMFRGIKLS